MRSAGRKEGSALGEIELDGVRLAEKAAVVELEERDLAVGVHGQKLLSAGLCRIDVELYALVVDVELREKESGF
jgi:hypothetical protein